MHGDVHLVLQVVEQPHVVVADEEVQLDAFVGQLGHAPQQPHVAFGHHVAVGEPKVEHVAEEHHHGGILLYAVQQLAELLFALQRVVAGTQVGVGDEVEFFIGHIGSVCVRPCF